LSRKNTYPKRHNQGTKTCSQHTHKISSNILPSSIIENINQPHHPNTPHTLACRAFMLPPRKCSKSDLRTSDDSTDIHDIRSKTRA
jgi:hypothetical protein